MEFEFSTVRAGRRLRQSSTVNVFKFRTDIEAQPGCEASRFEYKYTLSFLNTHNKFTHTCTHKHTHIHTTFSV